MVFINTGFIEALIALIFWLTTVDTIWLIILLVVIDVDTLLILVERRVLHIPMTTEHRGGRFEGNGVSQTYQMSAFWSVCYSILVLDFFISIRVSLVVDCRYSAFILTVIIIVALWRLNTFICTMKFFQIDWAGTGLRWIFVRLIYLDLRGDSAKFKRVNLLRYFFHLVLIFSQSYCMEIVLVESSSLGLILI